VEVDVPVDFKDPFDAPGFFVHGYYMYIRFEKGEHVDADHVAHKHIVMLLNINYKDTGLNTTLNLTSMHFRLLFKDPVTSQYQIISTVDKTWLKASPGKGTRIRLPNQFTTTGHLQMKLEIALGSYASMIIPPNQPKI